MWPFSNEIEQAQQEYTNKFSILQQECEKYKNESQLKQAELEQEKVEKNKLSQENDDLRIKNAILQQKIKDLLTEVGDTTPVDFSVLRLVNLEKEFHAKLQQLVMQHNEILQYNSQIHSCLNKLPEVANNINSDANIQQWVTARNAIETQMHDEMNNLLQQAAKSDEQFRKQFLSFVKWQLNAGDTINLNSCMAQLKYFLHQTSLVKHQVNQIQVQFAQAAKAKERIAAELPSFVAKQKEINKRMIEVRQATLNMDVLQIDNPLDINLAKMQAKITAMQADVAKLKNELNNASAIYIEECRELCPELCFQLMQQQQPDPKSPFKNMTYWLCYLGLLKQRTIDHDYNIQYSIKVSMCDMFIAERKATKMKVALKKIMLTDAVQKMVRNEIALMKKHSHPLIVPLLGVFIDNNYIVLEMPCCAQGNLLQWMKRVTPEESIQISPQLLMNLPMKRTKQELITMFRYILQGIAYLHGQRVLHRDLKPSNILVTDENKPMIADFGVSKQQISFMMTSGTCGVGTTEYQAPEVRDKKMPNSEQSDMYSFGLMLYDAMLGGRSYDAQNQLKLSFASIPVDVSPAITDLLSKLLQMDPKKRMSAHDALAHSFFNATTTTSTFVSTASPKTKIDSVKDFVRMLKKDPEYEAETGDINIICNRINVVDAVVQAFADVQSVNYLLRQIYVRFEGETGIDQGGLTSELIHLFFQQVVQKYFTCGKNQKYIPNPAQKLTDADQQVYMVLGKLMLKCLLDNRPIQLPFHPLVFQYWIQGTECFTSLQYEQWIRLYSQFDMTSASNMHSYLQYSTSELREVTCVEEFVNTSMETVPLSSKNVREMGFNS